MIIPFSVKRCYTILILIFINLATLSIAHDHGFSTTSTPLVITTRQESPPEPCGFVGTSDIYGIGIRIGYYAQAISIWLANFFVLREAKPLRAINTLFMFAMVIGLIFMSTTPSQTYSVEAYMMIQIIFVVWFVGTLDASKYSRKHWKFDFGRTVIRNGCFAGMVIYNAWYWWVGLDRMQKTPCGTFGYFFTKVALDGWYKKANMVLAILAICGHMLLECGHLCRTLRHFYCKEINSAKYQNEVQRRLELGVDITGSATNGRPDLNACSHIRRSSELTSPHSTRSSNLVPPMPFDQELATIPKSSSTRLPVVTTSEVKTDMNMDSNWPDFQELYAADNYISSVLSACPKSILTRTRYQVTFFHGAMKLYIPYIRPPRGNDAVTLRTCFATVFGAILRHHLNSPVVGILFSHIYALQSQPFYRYPWLLQRALTEPSHRDQNWRTLAVMTNIRFTRMPDTTRKWYWVPSAVQGGVFIVGVVLSVELTLRWNGVTGVNQIGTVGQLVPFVLGVGGLIKVLWSWLQMRLGTVHDEGLDDGERSPESRLANAYYERKEAYERSIGKITPDGVGTAEDV